MTSAQGKCSCLEPLLKIGYTSAIVRPEAGVSFGTHLIATICPRCDMLDHWPREKRN